MICLVLLVVPSPSQASLEVANLKSAAFLEVILLLPGKQQSDNECASTLSCNLDYHTARIPSGLIPDLWENSHWKARAERFSVFFLLRLAAPQAL